MTDKELIARLLAWDGSPFDEEAHAAVDRIEALKAKLSKAVKVLNALDATLDRNGWHFASIAREDIRATLAEIKGESHE